MAISIRQNPVQQVLVDSKGDIFVATADNVVARLEVGGNGTVLTADSSTATGVTWQVVAIDTDSIELGSLFFFN